METRDYTVTGTPSVQTPLGSERMLRELRMTQPVELICMIWCWTWRVCVQQSLYMDHLHNDVTTSRGFSTVGKRNRATIVKDRTVKLKRIQRRRKDRGSSLFLTRFVHGTLNVPLVILLDCARHYSEQWAGPTTCCAVNCANCHSKTSTVTFHRFPEDSERRGLWIRAVSRDKWELKDHHRICSDHFVSGKPSKDRDVLGLRAYSIQRRKEEDRRKEQSWESR